ncbi:Transcription factor MYBS3 [Vitis vinifera]|uniref:Transcription factor MYBS3 n=1 Tax=Vitis vinifera TaxID=29760 RepID=A0A438CZB1_VITVI|nr:Transcription factor MYBS3 [Vitis vinifera]
MTRRCSHCSTNGHNSRTCPSRGGGAVAGGIGGVKLFGVRLTDGSIIKKSASMGSLSSAHYHSSSSAAASPNPSSPSSDPLRDAIHEPDGYLSDDPGQATCSSNRRGERKKRRHDEEQLIHRHIGNGCGSGNGTLGQVLAVGVALKKFHKFKSLSVLVHELGAAVCHQDYVPLLKIYRRNASPPLYPNKIILPNRRYILGLGLCGVQCDLGVPWTEEEHRLFLFGLQRLGKGDWRGISRNYVISRTPTQVASHAQKYFIRQSNATEERGVPAFLIWFQTWFVLLLYRSQIHLLCQKNSSWSRLLRLEKLTMQAQYPL